MNSQAIASSSKKEQVPSSIIQVVILRNEDNTLCIPPTKYTSTGLLKTMNASLDTNPNQQTIRHLKGQP